MPERGQVLTHRTQWTQKKEARFLERLALGYSVNEAALTAGTCRQRAYEYRNEHAEFAARWDDAVEAGTDVLEDEARRRAYEGVAKPVYQGGECVGHIQEYSDTLLIFMLKGRRPEKFKDLKDVRYSGQITSHATVSHEFDYSGFVTAFTTLAVGGHAESAVAGADGPHESLDHPHTNGTTSLLPNGSTP